MTFFKALQETPTGESVFPKRSKAPGSAGWIRYALF